MEEKDVFTSEKLALIADMGVEEFKRRLTTAIEKDVFTSEKLALIADMGVEEFKRRLATAIMETNDIFKPKEVNMKTLQSNDEGMNIYTVGSCDYDEDDNVVTLQSFGVDKYFRAFKCLESAIAYAKSVLYEREVEDKDIMMVEKIINERNVICVIEKNSRTKVNILRMTIIETKIED